MTHASESTSVVMMNRKNEIIDVMVLISRRARCLTRKCIAGVFGSANKVNDSEKAQIRDRCDGGIEAIEAGDGRANES